MKTESTLANEFNTFAFETLKNEEMNKIEGGGEVVVRIINGKVVITIE